MSPSPKKRSDTHWRTDEEINHILEPLIPCNASQFLVSATSIPELGIYLGEDEVKVEGKRNDAQNLQKGRTLFIPITHLGNLTSEQKQTSQQRNSGAGSHWTALIISADRATATYADSLGGSIPEQLKEQLKRIYGNTIQFKVDSKHTQTDGYTCGDWTMKYLVEHATGKRLDSDIYSLREQFTGMLHPQSQSTNLHNRRITAPLIHKQAEAKPDLRPEVKPAVKLEVRHVVKFEVAPAIRHDIKPAVTPETKPVVKKSLLKKIISNIKGIFTHPSHNTIEEKTQKLLNKLGTNDAIKLQQQYDRKPPSVTPPVQSASTQRNEDLETQRLIKEYGPEALKAQQTHDEKYQFTSPIQNQTNLAIDNIMKAFCKDKPQTVQSARRPLPPIPQQNMRTGNRPPFAQPSLKTSHAPQAQFQKELLEKLGQRNTVRTQQVSQRG